MSNVIQDKIKEKKILNESTNVSAVKTLTDEDIQILTKYKLIPKIKESGFIPLDSGVSLILIYCDKTNISLKFLSKRYNFTRLLTYIRIILVFPDELLNTLFNEPKDYVSSLLPDSFIEKHCVEIVEFAIKCLSDPSLMPRPPFSYLAQQLILIHGDILSRHYFPNESTRYRNYAPEHLENNRII